MHTHTEREREREDVQTSYTCQNAFATVVVTGVVVVVVRWWLLWLVFVSTFEEAQRNEQYFLFLVLFGLFLYSYEQSEGTQRKSSGKE
jgi:high-affinity Fe2+/Pb2+ permease